MNIDTLIDKYFDQIEVEDTDFIPIDDMTFDAAYLLLSLPVAMLREYVKSKDQCQELPNGAEFWKETGLCNKLRNSNKYHGQGHEPLIDILDFLEGNVQVDYQKLNSPERIRLCIIEL